MDYVMILLPSVLGTVAGVLMVLWFRRRREARGSRLRVFEYALFWFVTYFFVTASVSMVISWI